MRVEFYARGGLGVDWNCTGGDVRLSCGEGGGWIKEDRSGVARVARTAHQRREKNIKNKINIHTLGKSNSVYFNTKKNSVIAFWEEGCKLYIK